MIGRCASYGVWYLPLLLVVSGLLVSLPLGHSLGAWGQGRPPVAPPEFEIGPLDEEGLQDFEDIPDFPERRAAPQQNPPAEEALDPAIVPAWAPAGEAPLGCRAAEQREPLLQAYGGTPESEAAVAAALEWLASHQNRDGSWDFAHADHVACDGRCSHAGTLDSANAATGLALMAFLGAGYSHEPGSDPEEDREIDYRDTIGWGLEYLTAHGEELGGRLSFAGEEGTLYCHGICTTVLCDTLAMTGDENLVEPAQAAVDHILFAQNPEGGGWRYLPRQAGDTSVLGWQIMALVSAHKAGLEVPQETLSAAMAYLDTVQSNGGANYGYTAKGTGSATTATGLLCRIHLGWPHERGALGRGAEFLANTGPSTTNMYFNYYATQVLFQYGGEAWEEWNAVLRDQLIQSQSHEGHETGSWYSHSDHGSAPGGRLYCTAMGCLTLETYYRHQRVYEEPE